ncbi:maltose o-acetyltransferas-like protein [Truncatella angustata]|uniref:Maltose o-acetyltransferas-like protein n=1 Tax=Truncatella angustata TaxID=152316 RepID=A0A9P8UVC9_9PEZI|nr:maltose o-acetyltransferase-like protein [Truncatella angustata]KAH6658912.1 maltose o-acetyltransferas-like protein [Truncatella angustata]
MATSSKDLVIIDVVKQSEVPVPWCDEFEKMISGMHFSAGKVQKLVQHKIAMMRQMRLFNDESIPDDATLSSLTSRRMLIARGLLGKLGANINIEPPFFLTWGCNIFVGDQVYINRGVSIYDNAPVTIGDRVLIGPDVCICTGTHDAHPQARREAHGTSFALPIWIESDCWIGARATILPGVRIGQGATVAAGAVVTKNVEPGAPTLKPSELSILR